MTIEFANVNDYWWDGSREAVCFKVEHDGEVVLCCASRESIEDFLGKSCADAKECLTMSWQCSDAFENAILHKLATGVREDDGSLLLKSGEF